RDKSHHDLDELFRLAAGTPLPYSTYSDAWLLRGFLYEQHGASEQASKAWREGLYKVYVRSSWRKKQPSPFPPAAMSGVLRGLVLASLVGELSDADYAELLSQLEPYFPKGTPFGMVLQGIQRGFPAFVHRPIYRRPRGYAYARQLAFHEFS